MENICRWFTRMMRTPPSDVTLITPPKMSDKEAEETRRLLQERQLDRKFTLIRLTQRAEEEEEEEKKK